MRICIDSCVWIGGLRDNLSPSARVIDLMSRELQVLIPRLIAQEVSRNLATGEQRRLFYRLFQGCELAVIVDEPVSPELVTKYVNLGLRAKADAFIGAFTEWVQAEYLISCNRHFLKELKATEFEVVEPATFLQRWYRM
jgi:predicted nucleic acid-binding protein